MSPKTREEIEALKENWRADPCWDIEDTEGFEEHHDELLAYRHEVQAEWQREREASKQQRVEKVKKETGITDPVMAESLMTFEEVANLVNKDGCADMAQANATLILAAQVKRVADYLGRMMDEQDAEAERQELRNLYRS
jgi:hypothetical protein